MLRFRVPNKVGRPKMISKMDPVSWCSAHAVCIPTVSLERFRPLQIRPSNSAVQFRLSIPPCSFAPAAVSSVQFSPWAIAILVIGALPVFISEAKFSGDAFRLFRWRSPWLEGI